MATSRSLDRQTRWSAGARVFSGRPDPVWVVTRDVAACLLELWGAMPRWRGAVPVGAGLGYRGSHLTWGSTRTWLAYRGAVTLSKLGRRESRRDSDRAFEKLLLKSAPAGVLPDYVWPDLG
jgi:hypothetical protein